MDLFKYPLFHSWKDTIHKIDRDIVNSIPFIYFLNLNQENRYEDLMFKKYYSLIFAIAIYIFRSNKGLEKNLKSINTNDLHDFFIKSSSDFYDTFHHDKNISLKFAGNFNYYDKSQSRLFFFATITNYVEEIELYIKTNMQEEFFSFTENLLLTHLEKEDNYDTCVFTSKIMELYELDEEKYVMLENFLAHIKHLSTEI